MNINVSIIALMGVIWFLISGTAEIPFEILHEYLLSEATYDSGTFMIELASDIDSAISRNRAEIFFTGWIFSTALYLYNLKASYESANG